MKELEYCSECEKKLNDIEKDHNRDDGIDYEEWLCFNCESEDEQA